MSDIGEAFGTAVEGGLFAKAIDERRGSSTPLEKGHFAEGQCLNCGTELIGAHCHSCGQKAHLHRTIGAFMHDLLHGALHFEGKTWRTLPKLLFKPGQLTRRYIEGERARFVSPMALFLFVIFLMFAVFQLTGISASTDMAAFDSQETQRALEARTEISEALQQADLTEEERTQYQARINEVERALEDIEAGRNYRYTRLDGGSTSREINLTGIEVIDQGIVAKWRKNPEMMVYKMQTNFYKFSWLLIPLSVPFVWLLFFWRRRFRAYDHAIFVTYSLSFVTLLFIALSMLAKAGVNADTLALAAMLIVPVHMYKQLRYAYALKRFSAFWRLMVLSVFIWIIITLFVWLLLALGAF